MTILPGGDEEVSVEDCQLTDENITPAAGSQQSKFVCSNDIADDDIADTDVVGNQDQAWHRRHQGLQIHL